MAPLQRGKQLVQSGLAVSARTKLANYYHSIYPAARLIVTPEGRKNAKSIRKHKNAFAGNRCVIIGNGPSLKEMDLTILKNEYTFGLNRVYLMFENLGFDTSFLVSVNPHVLEQSGDEIANTTSHKFISSVGRQFVPEGPTVTYIEPSGDAKFHYSVDRTGLWEGSTVTFVAMQLAFYMGFTKVILIGVDHKFDTKGPAHQLVTSTGADSNHFHPEYFGKGYRWQLPDLETSEVAYNLAKIAFESHDRSVVDATVGGALEVFPKVDLSATLSESR